MLRIRLQRIGRRNDPSYRVVVVESAAAAKKGVPVELLGLHDTVRKKTSLNKDRVTHWLSKGARPSDTMHNILVANGVIQGVKRNVLPKKSPTVKDEASDETTAGGGEKKQGEPVGDSKNESGSAENSQDIPSQEG